MRNFSPSLPKPIANYPDDYCIGVGHQIEVSMTATLVTAHHLAARLPTEWLSACRPRGCPPAGRSARPPADYIPTDTAVPAA